MKPRKIRIIGCSGSGKTWLGIRLAERLGLERLDLDDIFWNNGPDSFGARADPGQRDAALEKFVSRDGWVIEGVYHQWTAATFEKADLIIILKPGVITSTLRILARFLRRRLGLDISKKKESLKGLMELLKWNISYRRDDMKQIEKTAGSFTGKAMVFSGKKEITRFLESLR